jgi:hypothetical protein
MRLLQLCNPTFRPAISGAVAGQQDRELDEASLALAGPAGSGTDQDKVADKIFILQSADKRMHPRRGIGCLTYIYHRSSSHPPDRHGLQLRFLRVGLNKVKQVAGQSERCAWRNQSRSSERRSKRDRQRELKRDPESGPITEHCTGLREISSPLLGGSR